MGDASRQNAGELPSLGATHFEHRDAFGNEDVRHERREIVDLAPLEGSRIDPVDDPVSCPYDSNLHVKSKVPHAKRVPTADKSKMALFQRFRWNSDELSKRRWEVLTRRGCQRCRCFCASGKWGEEGGTR